MKLFNLTDVKSEQLTRAGLDEQSFAIHGELLQPGQSIEVDKPLHELHYDGLEHLVAVGALFLGDEPPEAYKKSQGTLPAAKRSSIPVPSRPSSPPPSSKHSSRFPAAEAVVADISELLESNSKKEG